MNKSCLNVVGFDIVSDTTKKCRARSRWLRGAAVTLLMIGTTGCTIFGDVKGGDDPCLDPSGIEWTQSSTTASYYSANDSTLGYGHYPESRTASQGSACFLTFAAGSCQGETTHIIAAHANYAADPNIDGNGNLRIAAIQFGSDLGLVSQFNASGSGSTGQTSALNGDKAVPAYVTVISEYPLSTAPADTAEGEQVCVSHSKATFSLE